MEYGCIGEHLSHSFSKEIHNALADYDYVLKELTRDDLVSILTEPKNAITKQFKASFAIDDVDLSFSKEAIEAIADEAIRQKTGARGLRAIVEKFLTDIMFEIPSIEGRKQLEITKDIVNSKNCEDVASLLKIEQNIA